MIDTLIELMRNLNIETVSLDKGGRLTSISYFDEPIPVQVKTEPVEDPFKSEAETYDNPKDDPDLWQDGRGRPVFTLTRMENVR